MFCPHEDCPSHRPEREKDIVTHSVKDKRARCNVCQRTFVERKGTIFYRRKIAEETIILIVALLVHGCPANAIEKAFQIDSRTVRSLEMESGSHCEKLHEQKVLSPREHKQIQVDEMWAKLCGKIIWIAMGICAESRLWLGASIEHKRGCKLINGIMDKLKHCISGQCLFVTDGFKTYIKSTIRTFRSKIPRMGRPGRPRLELVRPIYLAQVVKSYTKQGKRWICHGAHRCNAAIGCFSEIGKILKNTKSNSLHTAYIERLNATFRQRLSILVRKGRSLYKSKQRTQKAIFLLGCAYNFCTMHKSLGKSPAMAAGITDHIWSVEELLRYKIPPKVVAFNMGKNANRKIIQLELDIEFNDNLNSTVAC